MSDAKMTDLERARAICEPLLYQRPCTGDDIENPGLLLWRRDYDRLVERIANALEEVRAKRWHQKVPEAGVESPHIYRADNGIWRMAFRRNGKWHWSSLRTRDEAQATSQMRAWVEEGGVNVRR